MALLTVTSVASARRHRRVGSGQGLSVAVGVFTLLATACGVRQSTGVASIGTPSSTTTAAPSSPAGTNPTTYYSDTVDFARCVRAHGEPDFPDPNGQGLFPHPPNNTSAIKACQHLLPSQQTTPAQSQQGLAQMLTYARCMRAHGDPGFPDPTVSGGNVGIRGLDPKSPQFQTAETACRSLSPGS